MIVHSSTLQSCAQAANIMVKSERDEVLDALTSRIFSAMLDDIIMDVALQSHQEVARSRAVCEVCHTRCAQQHVPGSSSAVNGHSISRAGTPSVEGKPSSPSKDGTTYLPCVKCDRQVASNRYAPHLSGCMSVGTGTRKVAQRGATVRKVPSDAGRSASPFLGSENGHISDEPRPPPPPPKPKGRPPKNKPRPNDGEALINRKRPGSPQLSPPKNTKKQKTSASPLSRVASENGSLAPMTLPPTNSQSKVPSRLRESSTASFLDREASVSSKSRSSSPAIVATPSSVHSTVSTKWLSANGKGANGSSGGARNKNVAPRLPSPPRPPPPIIRRPETDYLVDVDGDETGSSTDTDGD
ncbi:hypothetical protein OF83DRAFT_208057 [Amylostereum chailletii]|nr:hypothetical protein OF83DRAFT_208057 [Amylostereum chailletii]